MSKGPDFTSFHTLKLRQGQSVNAKDALDFLLLGKDNYRGSKKEKEKGLFTLDRGHHVLLDLFRSKQDKKGKEENKKNEVIRTKLTRGNLRAAISRHYRGAISERIVSKFPEFLLALDFETYIELVEKLLNEQNDRLLKIAFDVFDFNQDKKICELDTYTMIQNFSDDDEVFISAFSFDLCLVGVALDKKRKSFGV